jgi:iron complex transport system substrate-binding protein
VRIVSLLPSATEIVYALGLEDNLVGVSADCDHPPSARDKPVVSVKTLPDEPDRSSARTDALVREHLARGEALYAVADVHVRELQPDLILAQDLCRVCAVPSGQVEDALAAIGCQSDVISLDPGTLDEVIESIGTVGHATGRDRVAGELAHHLRERVSAVETRAAEVARPRVLTLEWLDPPFVGGHWVPDMVRIAGGDPVLTSVGVPSRSITWDEAAGARPDVAVAMPCGYDLARALEESLMASAWLPGTRMVAVDGGAYFSRPGPRIVEGLEILAWAIHPDVFPAPSAEKAKRVFSTAS